MEGDETFSVTLSNPGGGGTLGSPSAAVVTIREDDVAGTVQFGSATYSVSEDGGSATITVTRTGGSASGVTVHYATSNGTATAGADYTAVSGTLTFAANETSKTITVPIQDDTLMEGDETFSVTLSNPGGGGTLGSPSAAVVTIREDDVAGTVQFGSATYSVSEDGGLATITVTRTGGSASGVTVNYATGNGTATAGADYTAVFGTLTFAANETSKTFVVALQDDTFVDGDETVALTLSNPGGGVTLGTPSTAVLTLRENDVAGTVQFGTATYIVDENGTSATITVTRTGGTASGVTVRYATSDGTATAGTDYIATSGTLIFAAGETSKDFTIPLLDDTLVDGDKTFSVVLSGPGGGATLGSPSSTELTSAMMTSPAVTVQRRHVHRERERHRDHHGHCHGGQRQRRHRRLCHQRRHGPSRGRLHRHLRGPDVRRRRTSKTFAVNLRDNTLVEGDRTFGVTLSNPGGGGSLGTPDAAVVPSRTTTWPAAVQFSRRHGTTSARTAARPRSRSPAPAAVPAASPSTTRRATAPPPPGRDYTAASGTLTFAAGETSKTFTVASRDDTVVDGDETVTLTLSSPGGGAGLGAGHGGADPPRGRRRRQRAVLAAPPTASARTPGP